MLPTTTPKKHINNNIKAKKIKKQGELKEMIYWKS